MRFSYSTLVVAALSLEYAIAQPAHHRHHHHKHRRTDYSNADVSAVDFNNKDVYKGVDFGTLDYSGKTPPPAANDSGVSKTKDDPKVNPKADPKVDPTVNPKVNTKDVSTGQGSSDGSSGPQFGGRTDPIDDGNKDHYIGNVGKPYGSNMQKVAESDLGKCKYSINFINQGGESITVIVWNKSGRDGQAQSGMSLEPNLKMPLGIGESQAVCFDENSQVAFSQDCKRDPLKGNLPDCTWGEADFGDLRNGAWSGYDRSSIPNGAGNTGLLTISCPDGETSSKESNSFENVAQTNAGGSLVPGPVHLKAQMG